MTKDEALKLALEALKQIDEAMPFPVAKLAQSVIKEALAQPESWEKFCDSNCVWTDHHPDCKLAQPEQEPVAWMYEVNHAHTCLDLFEPPDDAYDEGTLYPLYTAPPQRKPLTEDEVVKMDEWLFDQPFWRVLMLVRAIEAAHGITGEKNGTR